MCPRASPPLPSHVSSSLRPSFSPPPLPLPSNACHPSPDNDPHNDSVQLLWQGQLLDKCVQHYNATLGPAFAYFCGSVSNFYPFIVSPVFTIENMYDSNQIFAQMGTPKPAVLPRPKAYIARYVVASSTMSQDTGTVLHAS